MLEKPKAKLIGENGNVFNLAAICTISLKNAGYDEKQISEFKEEIYASKSYNEALRVMSEWCEVV